MNPTFKKMTDAPAIPSSQQAAIVDNPGPDVQITIRYGIPVGSPGPEEVLIKLTHTGIWYDMPPTTVVTMTD